MAIIFSQSISGTMIARGIMVPMGMTTTASSSITVSLTVYSGVQPSAATIASSWSSYNTTYLFHLPGVSYFIPNWDNTTLLGGYMTKNNNPTAVAAINSGTASWAIIWCSNVAAGSGAGQIQNATIPNTSFLVGPVTLDSGNGIVKLFDLNIISANSYTILDSTIQFRN